MKTKKHPAKLRLVTLICAFAFPVAASAIGLEVLTNGGFETGDTFGWADFPTASSTFTVTNINPSSGVFAAELFNNADASAAVIKQTNLAIGLINPGDEISISFDARGSGAVGGVAFAELFSEIDGGGVSASAILGGAPLGLNADPNVWTNFSFTSFAGPDVSGGISLQFAAVTGAAVGSEMDLFLDNVSVTVVPEPGTTALLIGLSGMALVFVRRRANRR
jgi:hypothetical protein